MGTPVGDIEISDSYKGILRVSSGEEGVSPDERIVYTSDGENSALKLGTNSATFTGTLNADEIIAYSITAHILNVTARTFFNETVIFNGDVSSTRIFTNTGEFINDATGVINSAGQANFTNIQCTDTAIFDGSLTFTNVIEITPSAVTILAPFNSQGTSTFNDIKVDNISATVESGSVNLKSPVMLTSSLTATGTTSIGGVFTINATSTKINSNVTCTPATEIDLTEAKTVLAKTQNAGDNSNAVATTAYVDRLVSSSGGSMIPDYTKGRSIPTGQNYTFDADGIFFCHVPGRSNGMVAINGIILMSWNHHYNYTEPSYTTLIVGRGDVINFNVSSGSAASKFFPFK